MSKKHSLIYLEQQCIILKHVSGNNMLDPLHMACNMMWLKTGYLLTSVIPGMQSCRSVAIGCCSLAAQIFKSWFCSLVIGRYRNQIKVLQYEQDNCWLQDTTIFSVKVDSQLAKSANAQKMEDKLIYVFRGEQDRFFQVKSRIENHKFIIMKSSKNQEFSPHVFQEGSNIKNFIAKVF